MSSSDRKISQNIMHANVKSSFTCRIVKAKWRSYLPKLHTSLLHYFLVLLSKLCYALPTRHCEMSSICLTLYFSKCIETYSTTQSPNWTIGHRKIRTKMLTLFYLLHRKNYTKLSTNLNNKNLLIFINFNPINFESSSCSITCKRFPCWIPLSSLIPLRCLFFLFCFWLFFLLKFDYNQNVMPTNKKNFIVCVPKI